MTDTKVETKNLSLEEAELHAQDYLNSCKFSLSPLSFKSYKKDIQIYFDFLQTNNLPFNFVSFKAFLASENKRGLAPASLKRRKSSLQNFFNYLVKNDLAHTDLIKKVSTPKLPKLLPRSLDKEKVLAFLNYPYDKSNAYEVMAQAILELLYGSGLRIAEVASLNLKDIFLSQKQAMIFGKGGKYRQVPLSSACVQVLENWLLFRKEFLQKSGVEESALFLNKSQKRLNVRSCREVVYKEAQRRGLQEHLYPHRLRHSFATHLLESSKNIRGVQELLGHSNLNSTQIYTSLDFDHLAKVYDSAHPRAKKDD